MATINTLKGRKKPHRVFWSVDGTSHTRHFATRGEAEAFRRELGINDMAPDLAVSIDERLALVKLRKVAEADGRTVAELVERMTVPSGSASVTVTDAKTAYVAECRARNLRPKTIRNYEWEIGRFEKGRESRVCASLRPVDVAGYVITRYNTKDARSGSRGTLQAFLRWCARQGWCDAGIWAAAVPLPDRREDKVQVGILRPAVLRILLRRLPDEYRAALAICCLTGLRPLGELCRLRWDHIDTRRRVIELPGSVTKTRQPRTLHDLPPAFWEWVAAYRGKGPVLARRYDEYRAAIHSAMDGLGDWPPDATRHSFASYGYHVLGPERTVELMGHIGGYGLFARRYKAAARSVTARLWFSVRPPARQ